MKMLFKDLYFKENLNQEVIISEARRQYWHHLPPLHLQVQGSACEQQDQGGNQADSQEKILRKQTNLLYIFLFILKLSFEDK